jgi:hypothetical protein
MTSVLIPEANAFFLHLPKTAGTSVSRALREAFPAARNLPTAGLRRPVGTARHLATRVGRGVYERSYSFCFLRNPWDWTVSGWKHVTGARDAYDGNGPDFAEFVAGDWRRGLGRNPHPEKYATTELHVAFHAKITQWEHLLLGWPRPRPAPMAFYARFERLGEDWARICERLGRDMPLPAFNVSARSHYTEHYDDRLRRIVAERNAPLIERFGYRFGE